jgi:hypothetical protein
VNVWDGTKGGRDLVDGYALEALKEHYPASVGKERDSVPVRCVNAGRAD